MPKVKMARRSTNIDMTAMCDVAFLLLTFFMLATKFKPDEPVVVRTPSSVSDLPLQDTSILMITVDKKDRIFFTIDRKTVKGYEEDTGHEARRDLITRMNSYKNLRLNQTQIENFVLSPSIGVPLRQLPAYLALSPGDARGMDASITGIPADTANTDANELAAWIQTARISNKYLRVVIKADGETTYPSVQKVIGTLGSLKMFRFYLITNLEEAPSGSAIATRRAAPPVQGTNPNPQAQ